MSYYQKYLNQLLVLNFDSKTCHDLLHKNMLDKALEKVLESYKEVTQLQTLLAGFSNYPAALFNSVLAHLTQQKNNIVEFYESHFERISFIGNAGAYNAPDVIVVLGAHQHLIDMRMAGAITYFNQNPKSQIVFSGGGFSSQGTESEYMLTLAQKAGIKNPILLESFSMDTIGNALFTKLLLKQNNLLTAQTAITVITSRFHAYRSLYYFNTVFGISGVDKIAVKGVKDTGQDIKNLAMHELLTEYQSQSTLGIFEHDGLDDTALLIKMFQHHQLYSNRYDLLRVFLKLAES